MPGPAIAPSIKLVAGCLIVWWLPRLPGLAKSLRVACHVHAVTVLPDTTTAYRPAGEG